MPIRSTASRRIRLITPVAPATGSAPVLAYASAQRRCAPPRGIRLLASARPGIAFTLRPPGLPAVSPATRLLPLRADHGYSPAPRELVNRECRGEELCQCRVR